MENVLWTPSWFGLGPKVTRDIIHRIDPSRPISRKEQLFRLWEACDQSLYYIALEAREAADSWRGFSVSCAVYGFYEKLPEWGESRWVTLRGANTKAIEEGRPVCAEPVGLVNARLAKCSEVIAFLIMGKPQKDSWSGLEPPTLHPCHECRILMKYSKIMRPYTRIITVTPPELGIRWEVHTLQQMLRLHGE